MSPDDPMVARAQRRVNQTLRGKWRLDQLLGVGGMAAVYAATHRNGSRAAIKVLHRELSVETEIKERFLREGYLSNAVEHPGVVRALDDDEAEDGSVFLVLELLTGETVEARQERAGGRLPQDEALILGDSLLTILAAAHTKGIIHRDLKPENLFCCSDGSLKLLDFGIARLREGAAKLTQTGMTLGTPAFMAPEQALGRSDMIGPWTDLWGAGAVLFSLLTGQTVHSGRSVNELLIAAATKQAPSLKVALPQAPAPLVALVDRALAFEPAARWSSAVEMQQALRDIPRVPIQPRSSGPVPPVSQVRPLRVGLVSSAGEQARGILEVGLEGVLAEPCQVRLWPSYASLVEALDDEEVDLAWLPPVAYLRARQLGAAQLLASIERSGRTSYGSVLLGRTGVVDSLHAIAGKRAAWVDAWSAAGHLVPRALLRAAGLDPDTLFISESFFGSYDAVLAALRTGRAEVGACFARLDAKGQLLGGPWQADGGVTVLAVGGPIPGDTLCVGRHVNEDRSRRLQGMLTGKQVPPALLVVLQATLLRSADTTAYEIFQKTYLGP